MHFARQHAETSGWSILQASDQLVSSHGPARLDIPAGAAGVLVIVDYADRWTPSSLQALFADVLLLAGHRAGALRFLLLARSAGLWWVGLARLLESEFGIPAEALELPPLAEDISGADLFASARDLFARKMGVTGAEQIPVITEPGRPDSGQALTVLMAALAAVDARYRGATPPRDADRISRYLYEREVAYWTTRVMATSPEDMRRAVYAAVLTGPLEREDAIEVLDRLKLNNANQILDDHRNCYPPSDDRTVLEPLYPDRLGEDFLALTTPGHDRIRGEAADWAARATIRLLAPGGNRSQEVPPYAARAVTVLAETAHRWPHMTREQLNPLLGKRPELAVAAGAAALSRLLGLSGVDPGVLAGIDACVPDAYELEIELYEVAAELAKRSLGPRLDQAADDPGRARIYAICGRKLGSAERNDEGRDASSKAVDIYLRLYRESGACGTDLAGALTDLSYRLYLLGDRVSARARADEAVDVWGQLPGGAADSPADAAESFNALGIALDDPGERESARRAYQRSLELRRQIPGSDPERNIFVAASLLNIGLTFSEPEERSEAESYLGESVRIYRAGIKAGHRGGGRIGLMRALSGLASAQWDLGKRTEAIDNSRESTDLALALARDSPAAIVDDPANMLSGLRSRLGAVGRIADAQSLTEDVIGFYREAARKRGSASASAHLGFLLSELGRDQEALESFDQAIRLNPEDSAPYHNRGYALERLGRDQEALESYDQAIRLNPEDSAPYHNRGNALGNLGRDREALESYDQAIRLNPEFAGSHFCRGLTLAGLGRDQEAIESFDQAIRLNPEDSAPYHNRGYALERLGRDQEALESYDQAIRLNPEDSASYCNRGNAFAGLGRDQEAIESFDQAIRLNPEDSAPYHNRGNALGRLARYREALESFDQAIRLDPECVDSRRGRGLSLRGLGRDQEAIESFDRAIRLNPEDNAPYRYRGDALERLGRYREALESYDQAIRLHPEDDDIHLSRGTAILRIGEFGDALAAFDRALALNPGSAAAAGSRGVALLMLGRAEAALDALDHALALDPACAPAHGNKGITLAATGDFGGALAEFDAAECLEPDGGGEGRTWAGAILWHQHEPDKARGKFARVAGRVTGCTPFRTAEMEALALCGLGEAANAERHLADALHLRTRGDMAEPRTVYDLLSDPLLPGIENLRRMTETGI